jgi:hypothetical protein
MTSGGTSIQPSGEARQHLDQARAYKDKGEFEQALLDCESAVQVAPDWAEAHNLHSEVLGELGRDEEAMAAFLEATRLDPSLLEAQEEWPAKRAEAKAGEMKTVPVIRCEQCGREGREAIFACPERPLGHCAYTEELRYKMTSRRLSILLLLLTIALVLTIGIIFSPEGLLRWVSVLAILLGGALLVFAFRAETVVLYHEESGVRVERTILWGRELGYAWISPPELVPVDLKLPRPLVHAPSISALPEKSRNVSVEQVVAVVRSALVAMLAQEYIQVRHHQVHRFNRQGRVKSVDDVYLLVGAPLLGEVQFRGKLEREISRILWGKPQSDGLRSDHLVHAIYEKDQDNPKTWLAKLVADDAEAQGLGHRKWGSFELDAAHINQIQQEREILEGLSEQLSRSHPSFSSALDEQIAAGIAARQADRGC